MPAEVTGSPIRADVRVGSGQARAQSGHLSHRSGSCGHPAHPNLAVRSDTIQRSGSGPQPRNGRVGGHDRWIRRGRRSIAAADTCPAAPAPRPPPAIRSVHGSGRPRKASPTAGGSNRVSAAAPHSSGQAAGTGHVRSAATADTAAHLGQLALLRDQRTVNPPMVRARYKLLYSCSGSAGCWRPGEQAA
jgi:hypothetical protein